jgi:hypothetical protein
MTRLPLDRAGTGIELVVEAMKSSLDMKNAAAADLGRRGTAQIDYLM